MSESFLYEEKHFELIINKAAVIIVLVIFISAYILNFFMDVNTQSYFFFLANWTDGTLQQKKGNKNRDNVERVLGLLAETGRS